MVSNECCSEKVDLKNINNTLDISSKQQLLAFDVALGKNQI